MNESNERQLENYSNQYGNVVKKMFYLCKFILSKETSETQTVIDQISNCLNDHLTFLRLSIHLADLF